VRGHSQGVEGMAGSSVKERSEDFIARI